jgi:hypothetical protein
MDQISNFDTLKGQLSSQYNINTTTISQIQPVFETGMNFTLSEDNDFDTGRTTVIARCAFKDVTFEKIEAGLQKLVGGGEEWKNVFPEQIRDTLTAISIKEAGIGITYGDGSGNLAFFDFHLGFKISPWSPLPINLSVTLTDIQFFVNDPTDCYQARMVRAIFQGELTVLDAKFTVTLKAPEFSIYAELKSDQASEINTANLPKLPGPTLKQFKFSAVPGSYYSLLLDTDKVLSWKINNKQASVHANASLYYNVPPTADGTSGFPVSGWHFEAELEADSVQGSIGLQDLLDELKTSVGLPVVTAPSSIAAFTLRGLSLDYDRASGDFKLSAIGQLPLKAAPEAAAMDVLSSSNPTGGEPGITAQINVHIENQTDGTSQKTFGGVLTFTLASGERLEFDLVFQSGADSKTFMALYRDPAGVAQLSVNDLVSLVSADWSGSIPANLKLTLKRALYAYMSGTQSKHLFGLDFDAGIDLTGISLPDLPFVSTGPLPRDQRLELAFRLLAVSQAFGSQDITTLETLVRDGLDLPPDGIGKVQIQTALKMGDVTQQLNLPVSDGLSTGGVPDATTVPQVTAVSNDGVQWLTLQKALGPVYFERVGLSIQGSSVSAVLDASLTVSALKIALDGLTMSSPLSGFNPQFSLRGLSIEFRNDNLEIGGSFLRQELQRTKGDGTKESYTAYGGTAVVRAGKLTLSAIGSYATYQGEPSLFLYAVLDYPIGGPSFFFVTGLAAGFGYNRRLIPPGVKNVDSFPLVAQVKNNDTKLPVLASAQAQQDELTKRLAALEQYVPQETGQYFLAAGIHFTSFKIIDSFVLLAVQFGRQVEIDLLGSSLLTAPAGAGAQTPVAKAKLNIEARYLPHEGTLTVRGELSPDSYILSEKCHLQGGFAFYAWFKDKPEESIIAGDFCLTLGGYHPKYIPPARYPQVPRLSIAWQVSDKLSVKGSAYFALTPHAIMAGGNFDATWQDGAVRAWFKTGVDFLVSWQPYHYDAHAHVSIGASYTFKMFWGNKTVKGELGADVHIWGPDFALTAQVDYYIFSVRVEYNTNQPQKSAAIKWNDFNKAFLPASTQVCGVTVLSGLLSQTGSGTTAKVIMDKKAPAFAVNTAIPVNHVLFGSMELYLQNNPKKKTPYPYYDVNTKRLSQTKTASAVELGLPGVLPMKVAPKDVDSLLTITINFGTSDVTSQFTFTPVLKSVPAAMWGKPGDIKDGDPNPTKSLVANTLMGFEIRPAATSGPGTPESIDLTKLGKLTPHTINLAWENPKIGAPLPWDQVDPQTISKPAPQDAAVKRDALLAALGMSAYPIDFSHLPGSIVPLSVESGEIPAT